MTKRALGWVLYMLTVAAIVTLAIQWGWKR